MIYFKSSDIPGTITTKGFENTFEIQSIVFGQNRAVGSRVGTTGRVDTSVASIVDIQLTKYYDSASTKLYEQSFATKLLPSIVISLVRQDAGAAVVFCEITLSDSVITSYSFSSTGGTANSEAPLETFTISYGKVSIKNVQPGKDGTPGTPSTAGWFVEQNTKL